MRGSSVAETAVSYKNKIRGRRGALEPGTMQQQRAATIRTASEMAGRCNEPVAGGNPV